jgi:hypothetical protein
MESPLDPVITQAAKKYNIDPNLVAAVVKAEGDIVKAVQCSYPHVESVTDALDILCRSITHAMSDFVKQPTIAHPFVAFFGARWAPTNVKNDPTHLNENWVHNVYEIWSNA